MSHIRRYGTSYGNNRDLRAFQLQMTTTFTYDNKIRRLRFAQECRGELRLDTGHLKRIVFSDKGKFSLSVSQNEQHYRICGSERLYEVYEALHDSPSAMVWCAISVNGMIGPYFFENQTVTGSMSRTFSFRPAIAQISFSHHEIRTFVCFLPT